MDLLGETQCCSLQKNPRLFWAFPGFKDSRNYLIFKKKRKKDLINYVRETYGYLEMVHPQGYEFKDLLVSFVYASLRFQATSEMKCSLPYLPIDVEFDTEELTPEFWKSLELKMEAEFDNIIFWFLKACIAAYVNDNEDVSEDDFITKCKFSDKVQIEMTLSSYVETFLTNAGVHTQIDPIELLVQPLEEKLAESQLSEKRAVEQNQKLEIEKKRLTMEIERMKKQKNKQTDQGKKNSDHKNQKKELFKLRERNRQLEQSAIESQELIEFLKEEKKQKSEFHLNYEKKYIFLGGHYSVWRSLEKLFVNSRFYMDANFSYDVVNNSDCIIYLTAFLNHPAYEKMRGLCATIKKQQIHIKQTGLAAILREIKAEEERVSNAEKKE